jgi:DNA-binding GntR family transcriptional regulator
MPNLGAEHENLDQKVYAILKGMIIDRRFLPGHKIPQEKIARELGVSRTPVVNALKYLVQEKLVESKPRRGFYVRLFADPEMVSIFELREVLEGLAARRAAKQITDGQIRELARFFKPFRNDDRLRDVRAYAVEDRRFHTFIINIGAKEFLKSILHTYNIISYSYQWVASEGLIRPPQDTGQAASISGRVGRRHSEVSQTQHHCRGCLGSRRRDRYLQPDHPRRNGQDSGCQHQRHQQNRRCGRFGGHEPCL